MKFGVGAGVGAASALVPWAAASAATSGGVIFGGAAGTAVATVAGAGAAGALGSVVEQSVATGSVDLGKALGEGAINAAGGGITSLATPAARVLATSVKDGATEGLPVVSNAGRQFWVGTGTPVPVVETNKALEIAISDGAGDTAEKIYESWSEDD